MKDEMKKTLKLVIEQTSIGETLKAARKKKGMTKKEIARNLYLKESVIDDIESNKKPSNLEITFINGYIRSYAKLVSIPKKELQNITNQMHKNTKHHSNEKKIIHIKKTNKGKKIINVTAIFLLIVTSVIITW